MPDLQQLSDKDLEALSRGDYSTISEQGLSYLAGEDTAVAPPRKTNPFRLLDVAQQIGEARVPSPIGQSLQPKVKELPAIVGSRFNTALLDVPRKATRGLEATARAGQLAREHPETFEEVGGPLGRTAGALFRGAEPIARGLHAVAKPFFDARAETPGGKLLQLGAEVRGFTRGATGRTFTGTQRGVLGAAERIRPGSTFRQTVRGPQLRRSAEAVAGATGLAATGAPFAGTPQELTSTTAFGGAIGLGYPAVRGLAGATVGGIRGAARQIAKRFRGAPGEREAIQAVAGHRPGALLGQTPEAQGGARPVRAAAFGERRRAFVERTREAITERTKARALAVRDRADRLLGQLQNKTERTVQELKARLTGEEATLGERSLKGAVRLQQQVAQYTAPETGLYAEYGKRFETVSKSIADNEAIQVSAKELQDILTRRIPRDPTGALAPTSPGHQLLVKTGEELGTGVISAPKLKAVLKDLHDAVGVRRLGRRRGTTSDHDVIQTASDIMDDVVVKRAQEGSPEWQAYLELQNWYKERARVLDEAFRILAPRGTEFETARRLLKTPGPVEAEALQTLERQSTELGASTRQVTGADLSKEVQFKTEVGGKTYTEKGRLLSLNENRNEAIVELTEAPEYYSAAARAEWGKYGADKLSVKANELSIVTGRGTPIRALKEFEALSGSITRLKGEIQQAETYLSQHRGRISIARVRMIRGLQRQAKTSQDRLERYYNVVRATRAGRAAKLEQFPIAFPALTLAPGGSRLRTKPAAVLPGLLQGAEALSEALHDATTRGFIARRGISRGAFATLVTQRDRE